MLLFVDSSHPEQHINSSIIHKIRNTPGSQFHIDTRDVPTVVGGGHPCPPLEVFTQYSPKKKISNFFCYAHPQSLVKSEHFPGEDSGPPSRRGQSPSTPSPRHAGVALRGSPHHVAHHSDFPGDNPVIHTCKTKQMQEDKKPCDVHTLIFVNSEKKR